MAAVSLTPADLAPFASIDEVKALAMIEDAMALAARVAPCIVTAEFAHDKAAKAILRQALIRWHESGSGALQSETLADYSYTQDTRQQRRGLFWPSEIEQLQDLCQTGSENSGAFSIDTVGGDYSQHADVCSLRFGALYCSCGASLTGGAPLWE